VNIIFTFVGHFLAIFISIPVLLISIFCDIVLLLGTRGDRGS